MRSIVEMARKPALATNAAKATLAVAPAVAKTAKAKTATARPAPGADRLDGEKRYFLMKTEPTTFSLADLKSKKDCIEPWEGTTRTEQAAAGEAEGARSIRASPLLGSKAAPTHRAPAVRPPSPLARRRPQLCSSQPHAQHAQG